MARKSAKKIRAETVAVLREARADVELGVVQKADALNALGQPCFPVGIGAKRWSITGALFKAAREADGEVFLTALASVGTALGIYDHDDTRALCLRIWEWEDRGGRTIEHVLAMFERAEEGVTNGKQAT